MLSERTYWIILILGFSAGSLVIGFWIIPYGVLEYNLAINLLTSSIFMVLTIVLLTLFINLRETIIWKKVEDEVHWSISFAVSEIFNGILDAVENGLMTKMSVMGIQNNEDRKKIYLIKLRDLKDAKEIRLDQLYVKSFLEHKDLEPFASVSVRLSDIQIKYYRFLSPELTLSLMRLQTAIFGLETISLLVSSMEKLAKEYTATFPQVSPGRPLETWIPQSISLPFKRMIEEIYKISEMGYEISMPY